MRHLPPGHGRWHAEAHAHGHAHFRRRGFRGAPLHRRLFFWFGISILLMGAVAGTVMMVFGSRDGDELGRLRAFAGGRLAVVWHDDAARAELVNAIGRDLDVGVALVDATGKALEKAGPVCAKPDIVVPVVDRAGTRLGEAHGCFARPSAHRRRPFFVAIAAAGATLWLASFAVARRIGRPLRNLEEVAREIGEGRLQSRARLGWHEPGEVGVLAESINEMAARIEKQLADQRELLAVVSHEIRAPLARLRMLVEMLRGKEADDLTIAKLEREIVEIDSLVGDLLASSRLELSMFTFRPLDAGELAAEALDRAGLPPELLKVHTSELGFEGDATLVARALANLLDNAARHGGKATELSIREDGPSSIVLEVTDDGPGFDAETLPRAFEPFQRGHVERRGSTSLGLGLALVRRIAEAHGGAAWADNRPEGGAKVALRLARRARSAA
ncbi:MAG TPA: HAMP domain-containing sensor histidine kinase [Polyangiaceae bacterium]|jgi:signal transduction histidine kinase|nr:HAMP domain-containing sensor histidine kinase [Polyangiaceae bacterium]